MKNILSGLFFIIFSFNIIFAKQMQVNKSQMIPQVASKEVVPELTQEVTKQLPQEGLDKKKGLLIFLDDSEKEFKAVSYALLIALYQEASTIITSTSLLYTLFENNMQDINKSITDEMVKESKPEDLKEIRKKRGDIRRSKVAFQPDRWIIKKINNSLNLLLPLSYLKSLNIEKER